MMSCLGKHVSLIIAQQSCMQALYRGFLVVLNGSGTTFRHTMSWQQGRYTMSLSAMSRDHLTTAHMGQLLQRGFTHME